MPHRPLRLGVVAVVINSQRELLAGRRRDLGVWQLPQGGTDPNEPLPSTLTRELFEETGARNCRIVQAAQTPTVYLFPQGFNAPITQHYRGQQHHWFLCHLDPPDTLPDLAAAPEDEFDRLAWMSSRQLLANLPPWKLHAYTDGLRQFDLMPQEGPP